MHFVEKGDRTTAVVAATATVQLQHTPVLQLLHLSQALKVTAALSCLHHLAALAVLAEQQQPFSTDDGARLTDLATDPSQYNVQTKLKSVFCCIQLSCV